MNSPLGLGRNFMNTTYASYDKKITAIVMAAGYGKRFGGNEDKLLTMFSGKPMFQWTLDLLETMPFLEVILIARSQAILEFGASKGYRCLQNSLAQEGMSASIRLGVENADEGSDGYMFFTSDQPMLKEETVFQLMSVFQDRPEYIIVPIFSGKRGSPTIFPARYRNDLLALGGDVGGKIIIEQNIRSVSFVEIEDEMSLIDLDTKEALRNAESILKAGKHER